jgi:hypothetical protein
VVDRKDTKESVGFQTLENSHQIGLNCNGGLPEPKPLFMNRRVPCGSHALHRSNVWKKWSRVFQCLEKRFPGIAAPRRVPPG